MLPWKYYDVLDDLKSIPGGEGAQYNDLRNKLKLFIRNLTPIAYWNDGFEGPIIVARAIEVVPGEEEDRVWLLKLDEPVEQAEVGTWYVRPDGPS